MKYADIQNNPQKVATFPLHVHFMHYMKQKLYSI